MQLKEYRFEGGPLHGETRACAGDSEFVVPMCNETSWRQQAFTAHELVPDTGPEIGHAIYQLSFVRDWDNGKKIDSYYRCVSVPKWYGAHNPCNLSQPCP